MHRLLRWSTDSHAGERNVTLGFWRSPNSSSIVQDEGGFGWPEYFLPLHIFNLFSLQQSACSLLF